MNYTLPDFIKKNKQIRQALQKQEGGIVKYLADHLDANSIEELFSEYQKQCVEQFYEKNKWNLRKVWRKDEIPRVALGTHEHIIKEWRYKRDSMFLLAKMPQGVVNAIVQFNDLYLTYAYEQDRLRWHIDGISDRDIYHEVVEFYGISGFATKCMQIILTEHNATGMFYKGEDVMFTEFLIRQRFKHLTLGDFAKMRNAVAEMLKGKDEGQCRQMAIDTMKRVRGFSQMIYSDVMVQSLRERGYIIDAARRERDGEWLRQVADNAIFEEYSLKDDQHSMRFYFASFVNLLKDVGRIWAAQLLVRGLDMHELEDEFACIMSPADNPNYYVDKYYTNDLPDKYCIADIDVANKLLDKINRKQDVECHMEIIDKALEAEAQNILSKAYIVLVNEGFIDKQKNKQEEFMDILLQNKNSKVIWMNDNKHKFLKAFIKVILGMDKEYPDAAILKPSKKGKQWDFVERHFVDEKGHPITIKSNTTKLGKKDIGQFERILEAVYGKITHL